jgi:hypothetical protein
MEQANQLLRQLTELECRTNVLLQELSREVKANMFPNAMLEKELPRSRTFLKQDDGAISDGIPLV